MGLKRPGQAASLRFIRLAGATLAAAGFAFANPAQADPVTYNVSQTIGSGGVTGTIVTDGTTGTLTQANILHWTLTLRGAGASASLTSSGGQSQVALIGPDLLASLQTLTFNYGGTPGSYLLFQNGLYSGANYWCNSIGATACLAGASVVPVYYTDPTSQFDHNLTGMQVIATSGAPDTTGPPPPSGPVIDVSQLIQSIITLARARVGQMMVSHLQDQLLVGLNQQVSCGNCGGTDLMLGSAAVSGHGRLALSPEWTILGGADIGKYSERGAHVDLNLGVAASIQYDPASMGSSRPYASATVSGSYQRIRYDRSYSATDGTLFTGTAATNGHGVSASVQLGWVDRLSRRDEAAFSVNLARQWQTTNSYAEAASDSNPFAATVGRGTDRLDEVSGSAQYTHLFARWLEGNVHASANRVFNIRSGLRADLVGAQVSYSPPPFTYYEIGARAGVRVVSGLTVDLFVEHIQAPSSFGSSTHGGLGVRWSL